MPKIRQFAVLAGDCIRDINLISLKPDFEKDARRGLARAVETIANRLMLSDAFLPKPNFWAITSVVDRYFKA